MLSVGTKLVPTWEYFGMYPYSWLRAHSWQGLTPSCIGLSWSNGCLGHGGDGFLKFQDAEEISNIELGDAFEQMWQKRRWSCSSLCAVKKWLHIRPLLVVGRTEPARCSGPLWIPLLSLHCPGTMSSCSLLILARLPPCFGHSTHPASSAWAAAPLGKTHSLYVIKWFNIHKV